MAESHQKDAIQGDIVHEYDGILEADNELPRWWLAVFFGAILFAGIYWFVYHQFGMLNLPAAQYAEDMLARAGQGGTADRATLMALSDSDEVVRSGQAVFQTNCASCHGANGEGLIGPNLTDGHWIHGGYPENIYTSIREGWTQRGMPQWATVLGERNVQSVSAYVLTLVNTNRPGPRPPEGEPFTP